MTRFSNAELLFDPEIEKIAKSNKNEARERHQIADFGNPDRVPSGHSEPLSDEINVENPIDDMDVRIDQDQHAHNQNIPPRNNQDGLHLTLGELTLPDVDFRPSCIILPAITVNFELKSPF